MPKVSVIIPTYNRAQLLKEAIDSVLAQTYKNFELIVVDDNSIDNTKDVVEGYIKNFQNIRYALNRHKKGAGGARNTGIESASGEWVAFLDSDDLWREDKLRLQMDLAGQHDEIGLIFTNFSCFPIENKQCFVFRTYEDKKYAKFFSKAYWDRANLHTFIQKQPIFAELLKTRLQIKTPSAVIKKALLADARYDEDLRINEDIDFFIRVILKCRVGYIDLPLVKIRRHEENIESTVSEDAKRQSVLRFAENLLQLKDTEKNLSGEEKKAINYSVSRFYFDVGYGYRLKGDFANARKFFVLALKQCFRVKYLLGFLKLVACT
jgi:glycosyltransferase involved in cell wall biosynthesis